MSTSSFVVVSLSSCKNGRKYFVAEEGRMCLCILARQKALRAELVWLVQESRSKLQQQVQQMQVMQDQQAEEIARLHARQSQVAQPSVTAVHECQAGDKSGTWHTSTASDPQLHRRLERPGAERVPKTASAIRYAPQHSKSHMDGRKAWKCRRHSVYSLHGQCV